jgi:acid phosphatase family membrane protein YuiD
MGRMIYGAMDTAGVHAAASESLEDAQHGAFRVFANTPIVAAFLSFALAQSLKVFTTWYKEKRLDWKRLLGPGGMPSSHSATVMALMVAVGLREGAGSPSFAIAAVLAAVVMYDATGVRFQAGRQAEVLNQIVYELPPEHPLSDSRPLRDLLGHTPPQVAAGALLGVVMAYMLHAIDDSMG